MGGALEVPAGGLGDLGGLLGQAEQQQHGLEHAGCPKDQGYAGQPCRLGHAGDQALRLLEVLAGGRQLALGGQGVAKQEVSGQQRLRVARALRGVQAHARPAPAHGRTRPG